jgi:uncharacterized protein with FMN-binding domain
MRSTRKVLIAVGIIGVFFIYTFALRNQRSGTIVGPALLKSSGSPNPANPSSGSGSNGSSSGSTSSTSYKDGSYTGSVADAFYGNIQVRVTISSGKIADIHFLQYPNDNPNSLYINQQADPMLKQEAIQAQNAQVDTITGATDSSMAFEQSLSAALNQAKA